MSLWKKSYGYFCIVPYVIRSKDFFDLKRRGYVSIEYKSEIENIDKFKNMYNFKYEYYYNIFLFKK